jgi:hypothetical protein
MKKKDLMKRSIDDPPGFAEAWAAYPKRGGANPRADAARAWRARLVEDITPEAMLAGTQGYALWARETSTVSTPYVMQAKRFYGPDKPFLDDWQGFVLELATAARRSPVRERLSPAEKALAELRMRVPVEQWVTGDGYWIHPLLELATRPVQRMSVRLNDGAGRR